MKKLSVFLLFFISSILYADSILTFSSNKNSYSSGETAILNYKIEDIHRYKLKFTAYDEKGNVISPDNFSTVKFGTINFIIPKNYQYSKIKIVLSLINTNGEIVDVKSINLNINNGCFPATTVAWGDDSWVTVNLPFSFHGYTKIYPNTNGYITFTGGTRRFWNYVRAFYPMIWTSNRDLITSINVTICSDRVVIKWDGGYYPWSVYRSNPHAFKSTVILYKNGSIYQSSGGVYGF